jgi:hypothetical protein
VADDEFSLRRAADRAAKAKALIENETLAEAFTTLRAEYIKAWEATSPKDQDTRERLWIATTVLTKVRGHLQSVVDGGKVASALLADMEAQAKRKPRA